MENEKTIRIGNFSICRYRLIYILLIIPFLEPPILGKTSVNIVFLALKLISAICVGVSNIKKIKHDKVFIPLICYEGIIILSTIINKGDIMESLSNAASVLTICLIIHVFIKKDEYFTLKTISIVYFVYSIINIIVIFINKIPPFQGVSESIGFLGMDNRFVFTFMPMIIFSMLCSYLKNGKIDIFTIMCMCISIVTLIYTWSVGAIVGVSLLIVYYSFIINHEKGKILNFRNCMIFIIILNILIVFFNLQNIFSSVIVNVFHKDVNLTGRVYLWNIGIGEIAKKPILGYGIDYDVIKAKIWNLNHFHNYFVNMLYVGGILSFIAFLIYVYITGSKMMKYRNNNYIKIINFSIFIFFILSIADTLDYAFFFSLFVIGYDISEKIEKEERAKDIGENELSTKRKIKHHVGLALFYLFRVFKVQRNKVICVNYHGKGFGDSEKYIVNELKKINGDLDIVWALNGDEKNAGVPKSIRTVKIYSVKWIYEMVTAKIWINNSRFEYYVRKRKNQYYVQTWHGGLALKKVEFDAVDKLSKLYEKSMVNDSKMIDLMVSNSKFCTNMYRRAFKYSGEILEIGTPRNDILLQKNFEVYNKKIKENYGLNKEKNILLYAPTFRNEYSVNPYDIQWDRIVEILNKATDKDWVVLIKLHPNVSNPHKYITESSCVYNVSEYPDMQELIIGCNVLVTDYSSTMFEAMISGKPVFLYVKDLEKYDDERGLYFELRELPFIVCENQGEFEKNIENISSFDFNCKYKVFEDKIGLKETGNSSKKIAKIILEKVK